MHLILIFRKSYSNACILITVFSTWRTIACLQSENGPPLSGRAPHITPELLCEHNFCFLFKCYKIGYSIISYVRYNIILQCFNTALRLSDQTSIFGVVFFPSLFWELRDKRNLKKFTILTREPRSQVRVLRYRTWPIVAEFAQLRQSCLASKQIFATGRGVREQLQGMGYL